MNVPPQKGFIHARFDMRGARGPDSNFEIFRANVPALPGKGDVVNIKWNPMIVVDIGYVVADAPESEGVLFAFVEVVKAKQYKLELLSHKRRAHSMDFVRVFCCISAMICTIVLLLFGLMRLRDGLKAAN